MPVTVQVREFDGMVAWYRDVLGLGIGWLEAGEFCTLTMPGSRRSWRWQLTILTGSMIVRTGWTPSLAVADLDEMVGVLVTGACSLMEGRRARMRGTAWAACVIPRAIPSG